MTAIRKRRVFYLSGFDPRGVSAYHRLYVEEARKQAAWSGITVAVGERQRIDPIASIWRAVRPAAEGAEETTFEFLHWDDIAREHWHSGWHWLYRLALKVYRDRTFLRMLVSVFKVSKWPFTTGVAPGLVLFGGPLLALLAAWGGHSAAAEAFPQFWWAAPLVAVAGFAAVVGIGFWVERAFSLGWLLRTYAFVLEYSLGRIPEFDARLNRFAERIARYIETSDDDEIVVVGHSVGANVAVSVLARAAVSNPRLWRHKPVNLLTLGSTVPMLGLMPTAETFREELTVLALSPELLWVDMSAFEDAASFPLVNTLIASGITVGQEAGPRPQVLSGAFREKLMPKTYYRALWNLFRMHFQYLMASERNIPNDYLSITTGRLSFSDRFSEKG